MEKLYIVTGVIALLVVALASFGVYAGSGKNQSVSCNITDLVGAFVKNSRGDLLGMVTRVEDHGGQSFAIINHGPASLYGEEGGYTPVPVGALKIAESSKEQSSLKTAILNKTEKQLVAAPFLDPTKIDDSKYETRIDKFFGAQPLLCG